MKSILAIALITILTTQVYTQAPTPKPFKKIDPILLGFCLVGSVKSIQDVEGYAHTHNIAYLLQLTDDLKMVLIACTQMFDPSMLKDYPPQCLADMKPITDAATELQTAIQDASGHIDQFMKDCKM